MFRACLAITSVLLASLQASAAPIVGYFTDYNAATTDPAAGITAAGFTPFQITNIATQNFAGLNMIVINESNNGSPTAALLGRTADLLAFVSAGGKVIVHSRNVAQGVSDNTWVPGLSGTTLVTSFGTNIDVVTTGILPGITNTNLDGGNFSNHGYGTAVTLPPGAVNILSNGTAAQSTAFGYGLGGGYVYYSTIPLDFYLAGGGSNPPADTFRNTYYPAVLGFVNAQSSAIPEPATIAVFGGIALAGAFGYRRRKTTPAVAA